MVTYGWSLTDAATICEARTERRRRPADSHPRRRARRRAPRARAAAARRRSRCGPRADRCTPGLRSLGLPGTPLADVWRVADLLREYRGDAHTAAWTSAGFDATEIGLLTELYWGLPMGTYVRTRAWSDDQLDAAKDRLRDRGLLDGDGVQRRGSRRSARRSRSTTDEQCRPAIEALGDDLDELLGDPAAVGRGDPRRRRLPARRAPRARRPSTTRLSALRRRSARARAPRRRPGPRRRDRWRPGRPDGRRPDTARRRHREWS